ncbi:MAG: hypothetical protein WKG07_21375 [Hymenobacter sp.]
MITLGIIEDQPAIREALCNYLDAQPEFDCVLSAASHEEFMAGLPGLAVPLPWCFPTLACPGARALRGWPCCGRRCPKWRC